MRTHGTKQHNNRNTTNTLIKMEWILATFLFFFCVKISDFAHQKKKKEKKGIFYFVAISLFSFEKYYQIF